MVVILVLIWLAAWQSRYRNESKSQYGMNGQAVARDRRVKWKVLDLPAFKARKEVRLIEHFASGCGPRLGQRRRNTKVHLLAHFPKSQNQPHSPFSFSSLHFPFYTVRNGLGWKVDNSKRIVRREILHLLGQFEFFVLCKYPFPFSSHILEWSGSGWSTFWYVKVLRNGFQLHAGGSIFYRTSLWSTELFLILLAFCGLLETIAMIIRFFLGLPITELIYLSQPVPSFCICEHSA